MRGFIRILAAAAALGWAAVSGQAMAQAVVSNGQSFVQGRLLPGAVQEDGTRLAGLRLTMKDGWKTYWRTPGEAGIPPTFDWSASKNVASVRMLWPRPVVFSSFGMQTIGYAGRVVLPMVVTPKDSSLPIHLALTADLGVCKDICVLERFDLSETIEVDQRAIGVGQITRSHDTVPPVGSAAGVQRATCRIVGAGKKRTLDLQLAFDKPLADPVVVLESKPGVWFSGIETRQIDASTVGVKANVSLASDKTWITRQDLRVTVLAKRYAADIHGCKAPAG